MCFFRRKVMVWKAAHAGGAAVRRPGRLGLSGLSTADQAALLAWGDTVRRDLPWRRTRDPWAVLVSETMLQQTQVARVVPLFDFMERFHRRGLRRRRGRRRRPPVERPRLQRSGRPPARDGSRRGELGGRFPSTLTELQRLPGIGPYTARAVLAFAFEADAAVVDTNVARTLARWHGRGLRRGRGPAVGGRRAPAGRAWVWNQSLLDLGATVCTAGRPSCGRARSRARAWRRAGCLRARPRRGIGPHGQPAEHLRGLRPPRSWSPRACALADGGVDQPAVAGVMGWPDDPARADRVASTLVRDGLAVLDGRVPPALMGRRLPSDRWSWWSSSPRRSSWWSSSSSVVVVVDVVVVAAGRSRRRAGGLGRRRRWHRLHVLVEFGPDEPGQRHRPGWCQVDAVPTEPLGMPVAVVVPVGQVEGLLVERPQVQRGVVLRVQVAGREAVRQHVRDVEG